MAHFALVSNGLKAAHGFHEAAHKFTYVGIVPLSISSNRFVRGELYYVVAALRRVAHP